MLCPICNQSSQVTFTAHGYGIRDCSACHHRFADVSVDATHTQQVYDDQYFQGGGAGYPDYLGEARILRNHGRWYGKRLANYLSAGTMLDVGAAAGFVLQGFMDCGWQGHGIEPNPKMASYARETLGIPVQAGALENLQTTEPYDLVSMIQVVAHFADLRRALQVACDATKPSGYWLIETWNKDSLAARFFGQNWHEYSPPSVLHWFSPTTLKSLAAQYGFREVACGRPSKWINGGHAKSLLQYKLEGIPLGNQAGRLLNLLPEYLPLPYLADDLFWMLLRKEDLPQIRQMNADAVP
ncbi:MAG: class I SAM-dependent methyltransferase [Acidobacteria bacterium]|nr:class I SAM-dependent methyltransferase [Acidobacteriota bacterium]